VLSFLFSLQQAIAGSQPEADAPQAQNPAVPTKKIYLD